MMSARALTMLALLAAIGLPVPVVAQGGVADYQRAMGLREKYDGLAINTTDAPRWIEQTSRFYYRRTVKGGHEWILVDGTTRDKKPAFDHEKLAAAIASATSRKATAVELPFTTFAFVDDGRGIEFTLGGGPGGARGGGAGPAGPNDPPPWRCSIETYTCKQQPERAGRGGRGGRGGGGLGGPVRRGVRHQRRRPAALARRQARSAGARTTTSPSARSASVRSRCSAPTDRKAATSIPTRSHGRPTRRSWPCTRFGRATGASSTTSSPRPKTSCSRSTRPCSTPKPGDVLDVEAPVLFDVADQEASRRRHRALPQRLRRRAARLAQGQRRGDVRVQPARPPGVPRDRDRRGDRQERAR